MKIILVVVPNPPPKSAPPPAVVVVLPSVRAARPALRAVNIKEYYFFLKNPNLGFGLGGAAASAAIHSCIFAASHVI
jgi:hypothetical protein